MPPASCSRAGALFSCKVYITGDIILQVGDSKKRLIRIPPALDAELVRRAEEQGMPVNQLIVALLIAGTHFELPK